MKVKLGKDLKVGDVIRFWSFDQKGARIYNLYPYAGAFPSIICSNASLVGKHALEDRQHHLDVAIESNMLYEVLPG